MRRELLVRMALICAAMTVVAACSGVSSSNSASDSLASGTSTKSSTATNLVVQGRLGSRIRLYSSLAELKEYASLVALITVTDSRAEDKPPGIGPEPPPGAPRTKYTISTVAVEQVFSASGDLGWAAGVETLTFRTFGAQGEYEDGVTLEVGKSYIVFAKAWRWNPDQIPVSGGEVSVVGNNAGLFESRGVLFYRQSAEDVDLPETITVEDVVLAVTAAVTPEPKP